ncbi:tagD, partial [Symbiodinium microadriaticum]
KCIDKHKFKGADGYNGLAYNAKLTMFDVEINNKMFVPSLYHVALPPAYAAGARVHSNSWGCRGVTTYTSKALEVDEFMYDYPDFLFVVAAGNDGALGMDSVGSPGVSKNALTIGASASNHDNIVDFSGIGKAFHGMIKPDVIGPGTDLMSAGVGFGDGKESCQIQLSSGTSMATPLISATAILVKQYFESKRFWGTICNSHYRSCPSKDEGKSKEVSAALLKAVLVHSANDMKQVLSGWGSAVPKTNLTTPPDRFQGWGHVMLKNVLPLPGVYDFDLYVADYESLASMSRRQYFTNVKGSRRNLVVTIAWNDPPNVVWAAKNLLNDLDLTIISPSGVVFYGNNRPGDEFNSVERVLIAEPEKGSYTVQVTAKQFPAGKEQTYSIVITCDGYVEEAMTSLAPIETKDLTYSSEELDCQEKKGKLVRMQLEDWL